MADINKIKELRDRFLAFSFASSDLFLEVDEAGLVIFALGAGKSITGIQHEKMIGQNWLDLFAPHEHEKLLKLRKEATAGQRFGPEVIDLKSGLNMARGLVGGIKMPSNKNFYLTLGLSNELMDRLQAAEKKSPEPLLTDPKFKDDAPFDDSAYGKGTFTEEKFDDSLYNKYGPPTEILPGEFLSRQDFIDDSARAFAFAQSQNIEPDITVFDFGRTETIPETNWADIMGEMARLLREQAIDKHSAAEINNGCFSFIHAPGTDIGALTAQMQAIIKDKAPDAGDIPITSKTIAGDGGQLSPEEAAKALMYTVNEASVKGANLETDSLQKTMQTQVKGNATRAKELKNIIDRSDFTMHYQPIVDLQSGDATHYEMLCRFKQGDTLEWVIFAEDTDAAPALDLAVCERAFNYINFKSGGSRTKFSVNLSRYSIENLKAYEKLKEKLTKEKKIAGRVMFEITRCAQIGNLDVAGKIIADIKKIGFQIALDNFGAADKADMLLEKLMPDYVKVDQRYIRYILKLAPAANMLKNIVKTCQAIGVKVITCGVEQPEQAALIKTLGAHYAQGFYFGKPDAQVAFKPPTK
jgi:EAL domain-containing protein (putative c-di-GMP-specific phosphodiesterase class I)